MFSQGFVTLSVLLVVSGISLKAHKVKSERLAGSYSKEESEHKTAEEAMERLLAVRILDRSLGSLLTDGPPVEKSKRPPDPSPIRRSPGKVTYWPRRTLAFPFLSLFGLQRGRELLLSRRNSKGSRFSLSLDVPTNILSILIDLAKARDMRAKAAANAELMAQIGK
ncbi:urocortin-3-like [Carcharodon carcharias]|uniref:urocortin-3-like n=1 Tax=Carcharodon carcharias TaxID=13397 RepID=UPI001B7E7B14|nr:urocortin-3-like [Carcharodon carcharias]